METDVTRTDPSPGIELDQYTPSWAGQSAAVAQNSARRHDGPRTLGTAEKDTWSRANIQGWWSNNIYLSLPHSSNEDPTRIHDPRDYLALERNFLAHIRTANALALFGVALVQLFRLGKEDSKAGLALGATCAGGGMIIALAGAYRYFLLQSRLRRGKAAAGGPGAWIGWTVILGVIGAVFVVVLAEN
ncbi:MAG: hypothetical protein L6R42_002100 [Xanthoria sp. 1 TBL-2021]|nr:MAG: hypothetical protein L6R42_002100 [Xanthoria sp. 1 TBL-2021]